MSWPCLFINSSLALWAAEMPNRTLTEINLIEINWGNPMTLVVSPHGDTQKISTIEQALYWLRKKWPVTDQKRDIAIDYVDAAMHCLVTVGVARKAFLAAAKTAGFMLGDEIIEVTAVH